MIYAIKNTIREFKAFSSATPTILQGELQSFDVRKYPADQAVQAHISVWQSQLSLTWNLGH